MDNNIEFKENTNNNESSILMTTTTSAVAAAAETTLIDSQNTLKNQLHCTDDIKYIDSINSVNSTPNLLLKKSIKKQKKQDICISHNDNHSNELKQQQQSNYEINSQQVQKKQQQQKINNNNIECENNVKINETEENKKAIFSRNNNYNGNKSIKKPPIAKTSHDAIKETENENGNKGVYDLNNYFLNKKRKSKCDCLDNLDDSLINIRIASSIRGKNEFEIPTKPPIRVIIEKPYSDMTLCQDSLTPFLSPDSYTKGI